ncbi:MAG: type II secretion system GspH family protein [Candidatus Pacebacteria bacterium]|nr:type II secretion system GspH family protein [Candidatus Paceibacterota bacterium]MCF7862550.1 type II secretion system GspH family protein [Candidatus Paceibacterota bacterium]
MQSFNLKNKEAGFTLVETLVSLAIFSLSIIAVLIFISDGISNIGYAKSKITASYLAQQGIEEVRNMRDTYLLHTEGGAQVGWNDFLTDMDPCTNDSGGGSRSQKCYIVSEDVFNAEGKNNELASIETCSNAICPNLIKHDSGYYGYNVNGVDSGYNSSISIERISSDSGGESSVINEIKVYSTISWLQKEQLKSITFTSNLLNWIE